MKPLIVTVASVLLLYGASPSAAQNRTPLARGDISGTAGWLAVSTPELDTYNDWHGQGLFTAGAGWYWTDHLKTDVEIGATTTTRTYVTVPIEIAGQRQFVSSNVDFNSTRLALIQRYQFGRNQWFHPSLGAGIDIVHERYSQRDEPIFVYDQFGRQSVVVRNAIDHAATDETGARALVVGGFKGYLTRRAFFLSDMRVAFTSRPEDILLRVGFGVDF
jgi:hypothetical protein